MPEASLLEKYQRLRRMLLSLAFISAVPPVFDRVTSAQLGAIARPVSLHRDLELMRGPTDAWLWHWADDELRVAIQHPKNRQWLTVVAPKHRRPAQLVLSEKADMSWQVRAQDNGSSHLLYHTSWGALALDIYSPAAPTLYFWTPLPESLNQLWRLRDEHELRPNLSFAQLLSAMAELPCTPQLLGFLSTEPMHGSSTPTHTF